MENLPLITILNQDVLQKCMQNFPRVLVVMCFSRIVLYYLFEFVSFLGVVLPVWNPQNPSVGDKVARAIVYFVALIYMFLGMSIIADRFMSSIEVGKR